MMAVIIVPRHRSDIEKLFTNRARRFVIRTFGQPRDILFSRKIKGYRLAEKRHCDLCSKMNEERCSHTKNAQRIFQRIKSFVAEKLSTWTSWKLGREKKILEDTIRADRKAGKHPEESKNDRTGAHCRSGRSFAWMREQIEYLQQWQSWHSILW